MNISPDERWLRRFRDDDDAALTLVCFPHAGAVAGEYRTWPAGLPSDIAVLAVRYPGREERFDDPIPPRLEALAEDISGVLAEWKSRRLVLFGHCFGATVAHEVALRLQERGHPPAALCVSATLPPQALAGRGPIPTADEDIIAHVESLDASRAAALRDPILSEAVLPAVRGDYHLVGGYSGGARPPLDCPIYAYAAADDPELTPAEMQGWADLTRGGFRLHVLSGGHFYLKPEETALLADLRDVLDGLRAADRSRLLGLVRSAWQETLGYDTPDIDTSFFDAGGDSFVLISLIGRMEKTAGTTIRAVDILRAPTMRTQAELLGRLMADRGAD